MINSNLVHNIINVLLTIDGVVSMYLISSGCVQVSTSYECSHSTLPPNILWYLVTAGAVLSAAKLIINATRDGLAGMVKKQPPVADDTKTIVMTTPSGSGATVETTSIRKN